MLGKNPRYPSTVKLDGPLSRSGRFRNAKNFVPLAEFESGIAHPNPSALLRRPCLKQRLTPGVRKYPNGMPSDQPVVLKEAVAVRV